MEVGVILDVDGVIADTEAVNAEASVEVFQHLCGVEVHPRDFRAFFGAGADRYMLGVAEKYGVPLDVKEATRRREQNFLRLVSERGLTPLPGVLDLVREAQAAPDFRVAIATSGSPTKALPVLEAVGLTLRDFDAVVTAADVTRKKPDPEIYLVTAERMGLEPSQCVVVEDAPAGIEAAKRAGCFAIAVTNSTSAEHLRHADHIVESVAMVGLDWLRMVVRRRNALSA